MKVCFQITELKQDTETILNIVTTLRIWPLPVKCTPAGSARDLWPASRWSCRRAGWLRRYVSAVWRHSAQAAGCYTTPGWKRIPWEKKRARDQKVEYRKCLSHEKHGYLLRDHQSQKDTVNSDDRGHCWVKYDTHYRGAGQGKRKQLALMYN